MLLYTLTVNGKGYIGFLQTLWPLVLCHVALGNPFVLARAINNYKRG